MKIIFNVLAISGVMLLASCTKNIDDYNNITTSPLAVSSGSLFANATVNLSDEMANTNVNDNNFRLWAQYWTETTYRDETRYNINGRSISDRWWTTFYKDVIKDLVEASKVTLTETVTLTPAQIQNRVAINDMMITYCYYTLLTTFGNVPYTDALNIAVIQPSYDDASLVFDAISTKLDNALANLDDAESGYGSSDLLLHDDVSGWKRFGYSLKMRMGMLIADVNPAKAELMVTDAAPNVISSNDENIMMNYLAAPPNTNPVWEDLVQSQRHDYVGAAPFIDSLLAYNDPRIGFFFETNGDGFYLGQAPGYKVPNYKDYSVPSNKVADPLMPHTFFSYAEMELLKAEAVERGYAVAGTAEDHYNAAIDASVQEWGGSLADAQLYRAQPGISYTTAPGDYKQKIGLQSWFALYNRGFDAWTQYRRLDFPVLEVPYMGATNPFDDGEADGILVRMTYPVIEQNVNGANYNAASAAIGKDQITQKLWFDLN